MKISISANAIIVLVLLTSALSCKKSNNASPSDYMQVNLVADSTGFGASRVDSNLNNPWGIAISQSGSFWISANHSGMSVIYDGNGSQLLAPVGIPLNGVANDASPSGVVYNSTSSFVVPGNSQPAKFIFVTEDGIVAAWNSGDTTVTVADRSGANAVYKGVDIANDGTGNFIYATDLHNAKVDVFDQSFNYVTNKNFVDPNIPSGFAPFNIKNINGLLYVTYAKQKAPDNMDDQSGAGFGYVDIFKPDGTLVKRFASQGTLNSPWGIAVPPNGFGLANGDILIGNFGDGHINTFDANGNYKGQLQSGSAPIAIAGLWAITFATAGTGSLNPNRLYFTAGPQEETYGIFGYLQKK